jgi:hypothetical protein
MNESSLTSMPIYHKIENIFRRDETSMKIDYNSYRSPEVEYLSHLPWIATEKVDGTNIRICWDGHNITLRGRTENAQLPPSIIDYCSRFFTDGMEDLFEQQFGDKQVILFGEGYGPKIQKVGHLYRKDNAVILFDVMVNGVFLLLEDVWSIARMVGLDTVPLLLEGTLPNIIKYVSQGRESVVARENLMMEGVVAKPTVPLFTRFGERIIVKVKTSDFCQTHPEK